jgi:hypothetical protein
VRQWAASLALLDGSPPDAGADEISELEQAVTLFRRWDSSGAGGLRRKAVGGALARVGSGQAGRLIGFRAGRNGRGMAWAAGPRRPQRPLISKKSCSAP